MKKLFIFRPGCTAGHVAATNDSAHEDDALKADEPIRQLEVPGSLGSVHRISTLIQPNAAQQ